MTTRGVELDRPSEVAVRTPRMHTQHRPLPPTWARRVCSFGLVACLGACTGAIGGHGVTGGAGNGDPSGGGGSGNNSGGGGNGPSGCTPVAVPDAPLRRLTRAEYQYSVQDLFSGLPLPPIALSADPTKDGFTNNADMQSPSSLLVTEYNESAVAIANMVAPRLVSKLGCASANQACFRSFVSDFGRLAFRRPLTTPEVDVFAGLYTADAGQDMTLAVEFAVQAMLQTPQFLYRPELDESGDGQLSPYELATRISYLVWSSIPDAKMLDAARDGRLADAAGVRSEIDRLLADPRARRGTLRFFGEWLDFHALDRATKSPADGFDDAMRGSMRESAERFLWDRVFSAGDSLRQMFTATGAYVDARLAPVLGVAPPPSDWTWVELGGTERAGLLTHPALLAGRGYAEYPSPVLRGVFIRSQLLCSPPMPPPAGVDLTPPAAGGGRTNRAAYERATVGQGGTCAACHLQINPYGYAFESFDTMGRFRAVDNGEPVDTSGTVGRFTFRDGIELSAAFASDPGVRACVATKWLAYAGGGSNLVQDTCLRDELALMLEGGSIRDLVVTLASHPKFLLGAKP
jgi:hypothetical protein